MVKVTSLEGLAYAVKIVIRPETKHLEISKLAEGWNLRYGRSRNGGGCRACGEA